MATCRCACMDACRAFVAWTPADVCCWSQQTLCRRAGTHTQHRTQRARSLSLSHLACRPHFSRDVSATWQGSRTFSSLIANFASMFFSLFFSPLESFLPKARPAQNKVGRLYSSAEGGSSVDPLGHRHLDRLQHGQGAPAESWRFPRCRRCWRPSWKPSHAAGTASARNLSCRRSGRAAGADRKDGQTYQRAT